MLKVYVIDEWRLSQSRRIIVQVSSRGKMQHGMLHIQTKQADRSDFGDHYLILVLLMTPEWKHKPSVRWKSQWTNRDFSHDQVLLEWLFFDRLDEGSWRSLVIFLSFQNKAIKNTRILQVLWKSSWFSRRLCSGDVSWENIGIAVKI